MNQRENRFLQNFYRKKIYLIWNSTIQKIDTSFEIKKNWPLHSPYVMSKIHANSPALMHHWIEKFDANIQWEKGSFEQKPIKINKFYFSKGIQKSYNALCKWVFVWNCDGRKNIRKIMNVWCKKGSLIAYILCVFFLFFCC